MKRKCTYKCKYEDLSNYINININKNRSLNRNENRNLNRTENRDYNRNEKRNINKNGSIQRMKIEIKMEL